MTQRQRDIIRLYYQKKPYSLDDLPELRELEGLNFALEDLNIVSARFFDTWAIWLFRRNPPRLRWVSRDRYATHGYQFNEDTMSSEVFSGEPVLPRIFDKAFWP